MRRSFLALLLFFLTACTSTDGPTAPVDTWQAADADSVTPLLRDTWEPDLVAADLVTGADAASDISPDIVEDSAPDSVEDIGPDIPIIPDPTDVSSWEPEGLGEHPRLFFSRDDLPALRERAALTEGPHARLYAALSSYALRELATNDGEL